MDDKDKVVRISTELLDKLRNVLPELKGESDGVLVRVALNKFVLLNEGGEK